MRLLQKSSNHAQSPQRGDQTVPSPRPEFDLVPEAGAALLADRALMLAGRTLGRIGGLEVRLARDEDEIAAAQEVRYRVFYEERRTGGCGPVAADRRDADRFDAVCDHVLVFDTGLSGPRHRRIVGTYRLLRQDAAARAGFYSQGEFDMDGLVARHPAKRFLELGRSCVLPAYRAKRTIEALWQGIWSYVLHHDIDVMAGCASFEGTVPAAHAEALSLLAHRCVADAEFRVAALPHRRVDMDLMPAEAVNAKTAFQRMPPLIKGYLRLGAKVGEGCVIDHAFGTVDVFVVMPVAQIDRRYIDYYSTEPNRYQA